MPDSVDRTPPELTQNLGDRLAKSLRVAGLSHEDMAAYLEVHRVTIGGWCNNRSKPNPANIRLWAMRTGVPYEWLRDGTWPDDPEPAFQQVSPARSK